MAFTAAIVGRPNVGKSTLFNRLVGRKLALVHDQPGVTRDRRRHRATLVDLEFDVIDTAGLEEGDSKSLTGKMRAQTEIAVQEADVVLFVIDARAGLTGADRSFAELLRRSGKPIVLVANKAEARAAEHGLYDAFGLGLGEAVPVSAEHGLGMGDLRDFIVATLGEDRALPLAEDDGTDEVEIDVAVEDDGNGESIDETRPLRIAVVGRPNAGKSTLVNALIGEERLLTGPEAGITRDSIAVDWQWRNRTIRLFDTAGMRRKARVVEKLEQMSVGDALHAIRFAEVVVIVIDALAPFEKQDLQIADLIEREGRAPVIAFNKWDLVKDGSAALDDLRERTERLLPQIRGVRAVPVSARTGKGLDRLMEAVAETHRIWNSRISTARLNKWLEGVVRHHPPPAVSGRRIKLRYITQAKTRPPGFVVSCSRPEAIPAAYLRYLTNQVRTDFGLSGVPIRIMLRSPENPFAHKARKTLPAERKPRRKPAASRSRGR